VSGVGGELVRQVNGHLVFGEAVARVAETLSPLGAAARIVAEVTATGVELRRLSLEGKQIEADKMVALLRLEHRHVTVGKTIHEMHRTVTATEINARQMRDVIARAQRAMFQRGVSLAEKEMYRDILETYSARLIDNHVGGGNILTDQIDKVLNGDGALGPNQPRRPSPRQPGQQRSGAPRNGNRRPR
jgi:hypothetical protein